MKCFVTGGAGFIGSNMTDRLLKDGHSVIVYDAFITGHREFLEEASKSSSFTLVEGDCSDEDKMASNMKGCDIVFHFAANADVRRGLEHPMKDLEQNTNNTFHVLEAMRRAGVKRIAFSSTGSVYGEAETIPTPEDAAFPVQTSLYGASKLACEGLIEAYAEGYDFTGYIFRFVSILGERYPHGHVYDFCKSLGKDPDSLHILGDGHQKKSYLYVGDCINAILTVISKCSDKINIFNLGTDEYCEVTDSASWIASELGLKPEFTYEGGSRGWIGDNPFIYLDTRKIRSLGWAPELTIEQAVRRTVRYIQSNKWLLGG
ncbi:MAG: NAD-dependent epimerase/dehydratase family protein [Lachnospiraceae bacterium]|nr:NAD-dependent epimerase/dehydratase family protein [Lachnospiraceae bacterium]